MPDTLQDLDACIYILEGVDGFYRSPAIGEDLFYFLESNPATPINLAEDMKTIAIMCEAQKLPLIQFDKTILGAGMASLKFFRAPDGTEIVLEYTFENQKLVYQVMKGSLTGQQERDVEQSIRTYNESRN